MQYLATKLGPSRPTRFAVWSRRIGAFAPPVAIMGVIAHRAGLADGFSALVVLGFACGLAAFAILLALVAFLRIWHEGLDGARAAAVGAAWSLALLAVPALYAPAYLSRPALAQVSTDLADPPAYRALLAERPRGAVPLDRLPETQAALQAEHYPAAVTLRVDLAAPDAYALVLEVVEAHRWRIVDRVPAEAGQQARPARPAQVVRGRRIPPQPAVAARPARPGRIEAVARSRVFGFQDDVVIRVVGSDVESRIDVRSASRVGWHDLGANARRVIDFLTEVRDKAAER